MNFNKLLKTRTTREGPKSCNLFQKILLNKLDKTTAGDAPKVINSVGFFYI